MTKLIAGKTQNNEPLSTVLFHELIHLKKNKTKQKQTNTKVIGRDTYSDVIRQFRNVKGTWCRNSAPGNSLWNRYWGRAAQLIGSLSKDVFKRRMSTGSGVSSLLIRLDATKFVLLGPFNLKRRFARNVGKTTLPVDVLRSKTFLLMLLIGQFPPPPRPCP